MTISKENIIENKVVTRESGVELLRILAACMVIWLHTNLPWGMTIVTGGSLNGILLHVFEAIAIPAVDIFILISGFYLSNKNSVNLFKPVSLLMQYFLFAVLFFLLDYIYLYPNKVFSIDILLPNNYFITLYITMYFFSPYLNLILEGLNNRQCKFFFILISLFLSVYPIMWDYIELYTSINTGGISTVSRWNEDMGNNIITFFFIYLLGGLIRKTGFHNRFKISNAVMIWALITTIVILLYYVDEMFTDEDFGSVTLFYHNPLVIIQAVTLFVIFKKIKIRSGFINKMAAAAFTCYLLQAHVLGIFKKEAFLKGNPALLMLYYLIMPLIIYSLSYCAYKLYSICTKRIMTKFEKKIIYY